MQNLIDHRQGSANVITGGELRDDTTVRAVKFDLTVEALGNDAFSGAIDSDTGLITGSFYTQYVQQNVPSFVESLDSTEFAEENLK
jgi:hypothetical protein